MYSLSKKQSLLLFIADTCLKLINGSTANPIHGLCVLKSGSYIPCLHSFFGSLFPKVDVLFFALHFPMESIINVVENIVEMCSR